MRKWRSTSIAKMRKSRFHFRTVFICCIRTMKPSSGKSWRKGRLQVDRIAWLPELTLIYVVLQIFASFPGCATRFSSSFAICTVQTLPAVLNAHFTCTNVARYIFQNETAGESLICARIYYSVIPVIQKKFEDMTFALLNDARVGILQVRSSQPGERV